MEGVYPFLSLAGLILSFSTIYLAASHWQLGVWAFILGYFVHFLVQILGQLVVLVIKSGPNLYAFPGLSELVRESCSVLSFIVKFSLAFMFELMSYEVVPLILLLSLRPDLNISVWSIITQIVSIICYIGYSVSAYTRSVGNSMLAKGQCLEFKRLVSKTSVHLLVTYLILNVTVFVCASKLSKIFFTEPEMRDLLKRCLQLLSFFFVSEGFMMYLNSVLRMIGFETYVFFVMFFIFFLFFPLTLFSITVTLQTGTFMAIILLAISYTTVSSLFLARLVRGFQKSVEAQILKLEEENQIQMEEITMLGN